MIDKKKRKYKFVSFIQLDWVEQCMYIQYGYGEGNKYLKNKRLPKRFKKLLDFVER